MAENSFHSEAKALFFIPSFYGAITWGGWLVLYALNLVRIDDCSYMALVIFLLVEIMFLLSLLFVLPKYRQFVDNAAVAPDETWEPGTKPNKPLLVVLHVVGFIGLVKYVIDFSRVMGGFQWFIFALMNEAASIRAESFSTTSVGTQIAYAGWLAIGLTCYYISGKKLSKWWLIPVVLQFAGNLAYIDRSKPLMIMITSLLIMLPPSIKRLRVDRIARWMTGAIIMTVITFWLVAEWGSKVYYKEPENASILPGITYDIYCYGVSGFAYFNKMLEINEPISYTPERTFYPLLKLTYKFDLNEEPPSQMIDFYDVPFATNVGSFLEPWYRDGGFAFVILGIIIFSFGLDAAGLFFLKARNPYADYAWANICLTLTLAFMTNKILTFPLWLFCGIGYACVLISKQNANFRKLKQSEGVAK